MLPAFTEQFVKTERPKYLEALFLKQQEVAADNARRLACLCTRRSGKTHFVATKLLQCAEENPDGTSLYIALTKGHARRNLGKTLRRLKRQYDLPIRETERDGQLLWIHKNGHEIWLAGCKDKTECEKFRGDYYSLVIIDEGQSYPMPPRKRVVGRDEDAEENRELLEYLVNDVLDAALLDTNGQLIITGTPGVLPHGFFWEVTTGDGARPQWKTHSWSVFDNPHIPHAREWLNQKMAANGWDWEHPTVQREWLGKWVADTAAIIYPIEPGVNLWYPETDREPCWTHLPGATEEWHFVLGIDLGNDDATAFVLTASRRGFAEIYVLRTWGGSEMTQAQRAAEWMRLKHQMAQTGHTIHQTVVDCGGLGKAMALDLNKDYGVACEPAEKQHKAANIRIVRNAITGGRLKFNVFETAPIRAEMCVLPWNDKRTDHHESYSDHWCDALLYATREHSVHETWTENPPEPGSVEAINAEMAAYKKRLMNPPKKRKRRVLA